MPQKVDKQIADKLSEENNLLKQKTKKSNDLIQFLTGMKLYGLTIY